MPELPEVHTITKDLNDAISGWEIAKVLIADRYHKIHNKKAFIESILNKEVISAKRLAKNILINLEDDQTILIHLAMTGSIQIYEKGKSANNKAHVVLVFKKGDQSKVVSFSDTRMFGKVELLGAMNLEEKRNKYGPEPQQILENFEAFYEKHGNRKTKVKNLLLDQSAVSGLGNIYATEALFLAGIHPTTQMHKITKERLKDLVKAGKFILDEGIKYRGSTLPDEAYVDIYGNQGEYQKHFKVYLQNNCTKCKSDVSYIKVNGRGTYFCPQCQPEIN